VTTTNAIGRGVTDKATLRMGILTGPVRWSRGRLCADVRMTDTGRTRRIPVSTLRFTPRRHRTLLADRRAPRDTER
jgi:hypothetical protein